MSKLRHNFTPNSMSKGQHNRGLEDYKLGNSQKNEKDVLIPKARKRRKSEDNLASKTAFSVSRGKMLFGLHSKYVFSLKSLSNYVNHKS